MAHTNRSLFSPNSGGQKSKTSALVGGLLLKVPRENPFHASLAASGSRQQSLAVLGLGIWYLSLGLRLHIALLMSSPLLKRTHVRFRANLDN